MVNHSGKQGFDEVFGALGTGVRRGILERLRGGPQPVMSLAEAFDVSWPAVSKHLKVLEAAGLIERQVQGRVHTIALAPGAMQPALGWLAAFEQAPAPPPVPTLALDRARALASALVVMLAPALPLLRAALAEEERELPLPLAYQASGLRRRLVGHDELVTELAAGLAAAEALASRLADPAPLEISELQAGTLGPSRLAFLLRHHPLLADLGGSLVTPSVGGAP